MLVLSVVVYSHPAIRPHRIFLVGDTKPIGNVSSTDTQALCCAVCRMQPHTYSRNRVFGKYQSLRPIDESAPYSPALKGRQNVEVLYLGNTPRGKGQIVGMPLNSYISG
jgi:hypothetical protein